MLKVSAISIQKLKDGKLKKELPEFYELKNVTENNAWHNDDVVFTHTLNVLRKLEEILEKQNNKISSYLSQNVDQHTRRQLLFLATVFHDIAKPETFEGSNGETICFGHEEEAAKKVKPILDRFNLSKNEKEVLVKIIKNHGLLHSILFKEKDEHLILFKDFEKNFSDIFVELILFAMADTSGAQLQENDSQDFSYRLKFYQIALDQYQCA